MTRAVGAVSLGLTDDNGDNVNIAAVSEVSAFVETRDLDFGEPGKKKLLEALQFDLSGDTDNMVLEIGGRNKLSETVTWTAEIDISDPDETVFFGDDLSVADYNYLKFRFTDKNVYGNWKLGRIIPYGQFTGEDLP